MKKNIVAFFIVSFIILFPRAGFANNVSVSNVSITQQDTTNQRATIEFDISWNNSWRNAINHDAVWVFARYYHSASATWKPVTYYNGAFFLEGGTPDDWSIGTGTPLEFWTDGSIFYGFILQRSAEGNGDVDTDNIQFVWNWGADSQTASTSSYVKVFAVEMVYIPAAGTSSNFYMGDGNGTSESTYALHETGTSWYYVERQSISTVATVDANTYDDNQLEVTGVGFSFEGLDANGDTEVDNVMFPTGGTAFYVMKYEITQGQYTAFLNTLDSTSQTNRYPGMSGSFRHTITCIAGTCVTTRATRACNYLSWMDLCAYCDWAGMRPMTELEFEYAARGCDQGDVYGEYAWGSTVCSYAQTISGTEDGTETISYPQNANINEENLGLSGGDGGYGPVRSGIFATSTSNRETSGASYYGVMELSGNVNEQCVTIGEISGRAFQGIQSHGDGILASAGTLGTATNTDWPGFSYADSGVTGGSGAGIRGGSWNDLASTTRTSDRSYAAYPYTARQSHVGGRCARTNSYSSYNP